MYHDDLKLLKWVRSVGCPWGEHPLRCGRHGVEASYTWAIDNGAPREIAPENDDYDEQDEDEDVRVHGPFDVGSEDGSDDDFGEEGEEGEDEGEEEDWDDWEDFDGVGEGEESDDPAE